MNGTLKSRAIAAAEQARVIEQQRLEVEGRQQQLKRDQERDKNQRTLEEIIARALGLDPQQFHFECARFDIGSVTTFRYGQAIIDGDEYLFAFPGVISFLPSWKTQPIPALIVSANLTTDPDFTQVVLISCDFTDLESFGTALINYPKRIEHEELLALYDQERYRGSEDLL
jgi:hypothetical protein